MRKIILFFTGVLILGLMLASLCVSGAIFDTAEKLSIETYFFQPNNLSAQRVGVPATVADLGPDKMRRMLVEKYISEYFYTIPDVSDIEARMRPNSVLARMSAPDVFAQWKREEGAYIQELAEQGAFRTVRLIGDIYKPTDSDYWIIEYELKTWPVPNQMAKGPIVTRDVLYLGISDQNMMDFRDTIDVERYLESGGDPATIFRFGITAIGIQRD